MEEDKVIKRKKIFRLSYKVVSYTFIIMLMFTASFFIFYILSGKIAEKKGENPPFNLYTIISPSMTPNIKVYDVVFVKKVNTSDLKENDIITFYSTNSYFGGTPITHRIVEVLEVPDRGKMYRVKGDANEAADEEKVYPSNVIGKVMFKIPQLGKVQFFLTTKGGWLIVILIPALIIVGYDIYKLIKLIKLKNKLAELSPNAN